jgi:type IV secretion system protein VirD4
LRAVIVVVALIIIVGLAWNYFTNSGQPSGGEFALFLVAIIALLGALGGKQDLKPAPPPEPEVEPLSNTYGSAEYRDATNRLSQEGEEVWRGVFFGKSSHPQFPRDDGAPIFSKPENHTLIVARTRTGKGTRVIIPTLLRAYKTSALVIDPKGENAAITARARRQTAHVHIMNPWKALASTFSDLGFQPATFNPLDVLDADDPNAVAIAQSLAGAMCPQEGQGKEAFWNESASSLLTAVLLWLAYDKTETKTLARAREIVSLTRKELREGFLFRMMAVNNEARKNNRTPAFGGAMAENAAPFVDMANETYSGIVSNLARYTKFLSDPQIKAATATSSFSMTDLTGAGKDRPTTLYLVIPPEQIDNQKTWLRLMITAGMQVFKRRPPGAKYRCLFMIDEFPALGRLDDIPREIATMAGYGVDFALIIQDLAQLKDAYGDARNIILSNCAYRWFCNIDELSTAEYLSKALGRHTVRTTTKGENKGTSKSFGGGSGAGGSSSEGENVSHGETGRDLLTPDEVMNLGKRNAILFAPGSRPQYLTTVDYWDLPVAFESFKGKYPNLYWPLFFDPNPYRAPNDQARCTATLGSGQPTSTSAPASSKYNPATYSPKPEALPPKSDQPKPSGAPHYNPATYSPNGPVAGAEDPPKKKPYDYGLYAPKDPPED